jgi:hypothetical protein
MFIEFDATDLACGSGPAAPTDRLTFSSGRAEIHGRPVGFPEVYLYHSNDLAIASESITEVLSRLDLRAARLAKRHRMA